MSQITTATFEDGVLKPTRPLDLPPHARVRLTVELETETTPLPKDHPMSGIYEILSRRYASGHTDTAERHNEHQP